MTLSDVVAKRANNHIGHDSKERCIGNKINPLIRVAFLAIVLGLSVFVAAPAFAEKLTFSTIKGHINGPRSQKILTEAYQRLGIEVVFKELPGQRAIQGANEGKFDGEVFRIGGLNKKFPNLIMIAEPYLLAQDSVFSKKVDFKVDGFESLRPYRIGIRRGIKAAEQGTMGMEIQKTNTYKQLFKLLDKERVDVIFVNTLLGLQIMEELNLQDIKVLQPPIFQANLYHYLHKKHEALVPKVEKVLQEMKADGTFKLAIM